MKKLLLALAFCLASSTSWAQCTGVFSANTICGNLTASPAPPKMQTITTSVVGPSSTTSGDVASWIGTVGAVLGDTGAIFISPPNVNVNDTVNIGPPANTLDQGLNITQSVSGSASGIAFYNESVITSDSTVITASGGSQTGIGFASLLTTVGSALQGSREALLGFIHQRVTPTTSATRYYVGFSGGADANNSDGGTNTTTAALGSLQGVIAVTSALSGATNWNAIQGLETDVAIQSGASAKNKIGILIAQTTSDAVAGTNTTSGGDAALMFSNQSGTAPGWANLISIGSVAGSPPMAAGGCFACSYGANTFGQLFDFSSSTITSGILKTGVTLITSSGALVTSGTVESNTGFASLGMIQPSGTWAGYGWRWTLNGTTDPYMYLQYGTTNFSSTTNMMSVTTTNLQFNGTIQTSGYTIANLPACSAATYGTIAYITNGTTPIVWNQVVSSGSTSNFVEPVSCGSAPTSATSPTWTYH